MMDGTERRPRPGEDYSIYVYLAGARVFLCCNFATASRVVREHASRCA